MTIKLLGILCICVAIYLSFATKSYKFLFFAVLVSVLIANQKLLFGITYTKVDSVFLCLFAVLWLIKLIGIKNEKRKN